MHRTRGLLILLSFMLAVGCQEGPTGPQGPAGAQGPPGPPGPAGPPGALNRADLTGTFDASGDVVGILPAASVSGGRLPSIACYISDTGGAWLAVAQIPATSADPYCGMSGIGSASPSVVLLNGPPGWRYYIIAVW